jgi:AAA ATPase domain
VAGNLHTYRTRVNSNTRSVGRDAEVDHLRRGLSQVGAGRGQVVAIVGEAGVGKLRLTHEFTQSHRVQDWLILEASSVSYGKATRGDAYLAAAGASNPSRTLRRAAKRSETAGGLVELETDATRASGFRGMRFGHVRAWAMTDSLRSVLQWRQR